jgi:hypothetical protein
MKPIIDLTEGPFKTSFAPLCVLGSVLQERETLEPLRNSTFILPLTIGRLVLIEASTKRGFPL